MSRAQFDQSGLTRAQQPHSPNQGCGVKGFIPTSVIQGNPLFLWRGSLWGPFFLYHRFVDSISHSQTVQIDPDPENSNLNTDCNGNLFRSPFGSS